jgi:hypothetical protein
MMSLEQRKAYLAEIHKRYKKSTREQKTLMLNEFCSVCNYNRKYAIRLLKKRPKKKYKRPGQKPRYDAQTLLDPLKEIWFASDQACSKKLKVIIQEWLPHYENERGLLDDLVRGQLYSISPATIDRILKPIRLKHPHRGIGGTKPGRLLKNQIPIKTDHWDVTHPGFLEADTVAHCGNSMAGDFVWSLTLTDINSAWTENRATWNKGSHGVCLQIEDIEKNLPFPILGFDCDNGSEFLNYHLMRYFSQRDKAVQFTRSRPYRKNDNAHVEQKNWTHVRHLFGYDRFDKPCLVKLMNDLYKNEWSLYQNHFCPTMKLVEKKKINSRYYKRYDTPKTPYQRLIESESIATDVKKQLEKKHVMLNPFALKRAIEDKLKHIFKFVSVTSNVRQRL